MARIMDEKRKIKPMWIVLILLSAFLLCVLLCGCQKVREKLNSAPETDEEKPYAVKTVLKECSAVDADTGTGIYARYTELIAPEAAPETLKQAIAECNRRAE